MKPFDNYEISPCRRSEEPDSPGRQFFEVCEPEEADVWTLYGHVNGEGVQAIGDFATREYAEEVFFRITGLEFTGSYKVEAHLRIMHAGPKLFRLAADLRHDPYALTPDQWSTEAGAVIAEATGRAA
jgi:hypothetical protein